jgi:hypothetical protein
VGPLPNISAMMENMDSFMTKMKMKTRKEMKIRSKILRIKLSSKKFKLLKR